MRHTHIERKKNTEKQAKWKILMEKMREKDTRTKNMNEKHTKNSRINTTYYS